MRPVISYDDITLPYRPADEEPQVPLPRPPSKKRKTSKRSGGAHATSAADDGEQDEGSRELTHSEIWDDSALIDAWNAATEEYEAYHGPHQSWKDKPVNKSPLWYNTPSSKSHVTPSSFPNSSTPLDGTTDDAEADADSDSRPLDFDTFVPTHDPALDLPTSPNNSQFFPGKDHLSFQLPDPPGSMVDQDDAFTRALGATYWSGYWTAVYHYQRSISKRRRAEDDEGEEDEDAEVKNELDAGGDEGLVTTQR